MGAAMSVAAWCLLLHAGPELLLTPHNIDVVKKRSAADRAALFNSIHNEALGLCTPGSGTFVDPASAGSGGEHRPEKLRGNYHGSQLRHWMETLGIAHALTGDDRFARHAIALLLRCTESLPPDAPPMHGSYMDGWGNLMRGIAFGIDFFAADMSADERDRILPWAASYADAFLVETQIPRQWWMPYHNYCGVAGGGSGLLALALRHTYPDISKTWLANSKSLVINWLELGFDTQGAYCEGASYAEYGLGNTVVFLHALRNTTGEDLFRHPRFKRIPAFFAMSMLPGENVFDARNDAYYNLMSDPFLLGIAAGAEDGLARWLWEHAAAESRSWLQLVWAPKQPAIAPEEAISDRVLFYPGRGLLIARTGWNSSDTMFSIEAGPFYRKTHNQADKGHFTFYGPGGRWAIDSGYGNTQTPDGAAQSLAHNTVLIDGKGQALSGAGLGTHGRVTQARIHTNPAVITLDCTDAYRSNSDGQPHLADIGWAARTAIVVWPERDMPLYVVLIDSLYLDDDSHAFTWLLHTDRANRIVVLEDRHARIVNDTSSATFDVWIDAVTPLRTELGVYADHPRLSFTCIARDPLFATVLIPNVTARNSIEVTTERLGTDLIRIHVDSSRMRDTIEWDARLRNSPAFARRIR